MSLFDLIATDMRASFTDTPDSDALHRGAAEAIALRAEPALSTPRGAARGAALESAKMRFDVPDAAPTERLNRIIWGQIKGWNTPYPGVRNAVFAPLAIEDEDEGEEDDRP